jgi:hypothetical protein
LKVCRVLKVLKVCGVVLKVFWRGSVVVWGRGWVLAVVVWVVVLAVWVPEVVVWVVVLAVWVLAVWVPAVVVWERQGRRSVVTVVTVVTR